MNIQPISFNTFKPINSVSFQGGGKPIDLKYILENRAYLLPERVKKAAQEELRKSGEKLSLLDIHKKCYAPLLDCKTLLEAKEIFKEFESVLDDVPFARNSVYSRKFKERAGENFVLKMLQELWANLKGKDEVAKSLGMKSRSSIDWALTQINFVYFKPTYKTILKASDEEGNRLIASKTQAWNALHPDLMYAHNKSAAQGCKTPEYRAEHSKRMKAYDIEHPERREKIAEFDRRVWQLCPDVRTAMSEFTKTESPYTGAIIRKSLKGIALTPAENRIHKAFFKRFWAAHPEHRETYRLAKEQVRNQIKNK